MNSSKKYIAEFIGTCALVTFGCGTAMTVGCDAGDGSGYILTALAFGLVIVAMAYSIGDVSGCHVNPAVSLAMLLTGRMKAKEFVGYVIAQFVGGIAGAGILSGIFSLANLHDETYSHASNELVHYSVAASLIVEIILTFVFVFVVLSVTSKISNGTISGIVIGLTLTLVHILGIGLTGTSVNPARSLGPALIEGGRALSCVWVFIVAPLIGAVLAALAYSALSASNQRYPE